VRIFSDRSPVPSCARRVAASLAYIGLSNLDRVNLYFFSSTLGEDMGIARGKSQFHKTLEFLKLIAEAGHCSPIEQSQAFTAVMRLWLTR